MADVKTKSALPGKARWILYRELASFFGGNLPPLTLGLVAFLCGLVSVILALSQGATYEDVTRVVFYFFYIITIAAAVFLSLTSFVSEKRQGTLELLFTLPVSNLEIVLGKFLLGFLMMSVISIAITLVYVVGIAEAPWYMAVSGIVGLIVVGMYAYSIGMFASSLTDNYLLSLLIATTIVIVIDIGGFLAGLLPSPAKEILTHLHGLSQYTPFTRGIIPLKGVVFFSGLGAFFLFLCVKTLESRHWRG